MEVVGKSIGSFATAGGEFSFIGLGEFMLCIIINIPSSVF